MTSSSADRSTIDIGHAVLSYRKIGSGPNLLFVHGWPLHGATWRNVVSRLDGFTRYVIDLPGFGESVATADTALDVRAHADTVVSVIDSLGLDQVVLVGQDSGGMVCRFAAEQRPDSVKALVLAGTEIPGVHAPLVRLFQLLARMPGAKAMFKLNMSNRFLARTPLILGGTVYDKSLLDGEFRTEVLDPLLQSPHAMQSMVRMIREFSLDDIDALAEVHPKLTMPTLLMFGEDDRFFPVDKARPMAEQFGGPTEFHAFTKCKLFLHEEHPERFAELTRGFMQRHCGYSKSGSAHQGK